MLGPFVSAMWDEIGRIAANIVQEVNLKVAQKVVLGFDSKSRLVHQFDGGDSNGFCMFTMIKWMTILVGAKLAGEL